MVDRKAQTNQSDMRVTRLAVQKMSSSMLGLYCVPVTLCDRNYYCHGAFALASFYGAASSSATRAGPRGALGR
jgi:hypothetical protein